MSDTMQISPEDRERLAKGKFAEWFNELFDEKIEEAVKKHSQPSKPKPAEQQQHDQGGTGGGQTEQHQPRRRSLLETCLSDTFGF